MIVCVCVRGFIISHRSIHHLGRPADRNRLLAYSEPGLLGYRSCDMAFPPPTLLSPSSFSSLARPTSSQSCIDSHLDGKPTHRNPDSTGENISVIFHFGHHGSQQIIGKEGQVLRLRSYQYVFRAPKLSGKPKITK